MLSFSSTLRAPTAVYTLSLHDALPISARARTRRERYRPVHRDTPADRPDYFPGRRRGSGTRRPDRLPEFNRRSEEHTSELQSRFDLVCRLLLEKKNNE